MNNRFWGVLVVVLIAAALRLVPHAPNFSPIAAMALFGGAYLTRKSLAIALPLLALFVSDLVLGIHDQMPAVYFSFVLVALIGFALREKRSIGRVALASVSGSIVFFVVTNLSVWASGTLYSRTVDGLAQCFVAALPFFQNSLQGDLVFSALLFGGWAVLERAVPQFSRKVEVDVAR